METTIRLVRNATLRINYAGHNILVDPFFADKGSMQSAIGVYKTPRVHLTMPVSTWCCRPIFIPTTTMKP